MQGPAWEPLHRSRVFKSSHYCKASPDGRLVAAIESGAIHIHATDSLQTISVIKLPIELSIPISVLCWSPSSLRLLASSGDRISVFSARDAKHQATISNPIGSVAGKPWMIRFGATDDEILVSAPFGLKFIVFDLSASKAIEISNPKSTLSQLPQRTFSLREGTGHLAIVTRISGRDMVSIHRPASREVVCSWYPDLLDAQGVMWTPDGQWLLLWEVAAQGRKLVIYSADGQLFRTLDANALVQDRDAAEPELEAGIKACQLSPSGELCILGDSGRGVTVLHTNVWRSAMTLVHPGTIAPGESLQVWQEQLGSKEEGGWGRRSFVKATQMVSPPGRPSGASKSAGESVTGCSLAAFDASSTLLATRLEEAPCTVWVWDVAAAELRAVLLFHSSVTFSWHPSVREELLISCQDENSTGIFYIWDPVSQGPRPIITDDYLPLPRASTMGRPHASWLNRESEFPELVLSNAQSFALLSLADPEHDADPWRPADGVARQPPQTGRLDESASWAKPIVINQDATALDDTFSFRHA